MLPDFFTVRLADSAGAGIGVICFFGERPESG